MVVIEELGEEEMFERTRLGEEDAEQQWSALKREDEFIVHSRALISRRSTKALCMPCMTEPVPHGVKARSGTPTWIDAVFAEMRAADLITSNTRRKRDLMHETASSPASSSTGDTGRPQQACSSTPAKRQRYTLEEAADALERCDLNLNSCTTLGAWCPPMPASSPPAGASLRLARHARKQAARRQQVAMRRAKCRDESDARALEAMLGRLSNTSLA